MPFKINIFIGWLCQRRFLQIELTDANDKGNGKDSL
jgi:hypothetical protein